MGGPPAALRRHRRGGDERPRARRARARRERDGLGPRGRLALPHAAARRPASSRASATTPANVPEGAEVVYSSAIGPENPERAVRAARAAPRRPARRAHAPEADDRGHRHARQDDDVEHDRPRAARAAALDPGYLVGGEVRSTGSNAGWGAGEWLVVEADESDRSLLKLAPQDRGAHQRRARPPRDLRVAARRRRRRSGSSWRRPSTRWSGTGRSSRRWRTARGRPFDAGARLVARRLARSRSTASTVALSVPGAHNARNAAAALTAIAADRAADVAAAARALRRLHRRRPALRAPRHHARGRARRRRLRPPPDRGRAPRSRPPAR